MCLACGKWVDLTYLGSSIGEASFLGRLFVTRDGGKTHFTHTENLNHRATSLSLQAIETLGPGSWEVGFPHKNCGLPPRIIHLHTRASGQRRGRLARTLARDMSGHVKTSSWRCGRTCDCWGPGTWCDGRHVRAGFHGVNGAGRRLKARHALIFACTGNRRTLCATLLRSPGGHTEKGFKWASNPAQT